MVSRRILKNHLMRRCCAPLGAAVLLLMFIISSAPANEQAQSAGSGAKTIEIPFTSHDGHEMFGKLTIPDSGASHAVVVYVQTAEGMTVDMKRPKGRDGTFNYYDLYREKLPEMDVAFFSYEGRGVRMGDKPPRYETIDWDIYNTSTLENKVCDIISAVGVVKKQRGIDASRIFLMGASEGTLLASEAATRIPKEIRGLILYGAMSSNMKETFRLIVTDGSFLTYRGYFDQDKDGKITKAEFEADPMKFRANALKNAGFEIFDRNQDGVFTVEEMRTLPNPLRDAVDAENYEVLSRWAKTSAGVSTPRDWFKDHFAHPPIWTFLSKLDMPIGLFHGDRDTNTSIEGVKALEEQAKKAGKSRMEFHYFAGLDHSLNIGAYFIKGTLPDGHKAIFEYIKNQVRKK